MNLPFDIRRNNAAELQAYERVCEQLAGFDAALNAESIDGFLTALAAGARVPSEDAWVAALGDDSMARVFADPQDHAQARRALRTRLAVLCDQLDPEALADAPGEIRLEPLMLEWDDEERRRLVDEEGWSEPDAAAQQTGADWAAGFAAAVAAFAENWTPPDGSAAEADGAIAEALDQIAALRLAADSEALRAHLARYYDAHGQRRLSDGGDDGADGGEGDKATSAAAGAEPALPPSRDDLIAEACLSAQDLRLLWVDLAPRTTTRSVAPTPGRNDPCPCGSGKKYKKCHGAAA